MHDLLDARCGIGLTIETVSRTLSQLRSALADLLVVLQNTKSVPEAEGPKSWENLTDKKWKGNVAFTSAKVAPLGDGRAAVGAGRAAGGLLRRRLGASR